jgi:hypothetical protein
MAGGYSRRCPLFDIWELSPAEKKIIVAIAQFDNVEKVSAVLNISMSL